MEPTQQTLTPASNRDPQELQAHEILQRVNNSVQSVFEIFERTNRDTAEQIEFYSSDNEILLKIRTSNPKVYERRTKENTENCELLHA